MGGRRRGPFCTVSVLFRVACVDEERGYSFALCQVKEEEEDDQADSQAKAGRHRLRQLSEAVPRPRFLRVCSATLDARDFLPQARRRRARTMMTRGRRASRSGRGKSSRG